MSEDEREARRLLHHAAAAWERHQDAWETLAHRLPEPYRQIALDNGSDAYHQKAGLLSFLESGGAP